MVAIDGSDAGNSAFYTALELVSLAKHDHLYLICIVGAVRRVNYVSHIPTHILQDAKENRKRGYRSLMRTYGRICEDRGINYTSIIAISNNVGEMICQAVEKKHIDFLVLGRRGMGKIKRWFLGSTSQYCMENAKCNVVVVKKGWRISPEQVQEIMAAEQYESLETQPTTPSEIEQPKQQPMQTNVGVTPISGYGSPTSGYGSGYSTPTSGYTTPTYPEKYPVSTSQYNQHEETMNQYGEPVDSSEISNINSNNNSHWHPFRK